MPRSAKGSRPKNVFETVSGLRPGRSVFNLSYEKKMTCDMGMLVPCYAQECVPGDKFVVGNEIVVRMGPALSPILHELNVFVHYFFVPYRLLWPGDEVGPNTWESFISGGPNGTDASVLPKWSVTNNAMGSLWDYLGFPIGQTGSANFKPMAFPMNAYNLIYNEYYRDQDLIGKVSLSNESILLRAWEKDYFTSARPWRQRGTAPALPITVGGTVTPSGTGSYPILRHSADGNQITSHDTVAANAGFTVKSTGAVTAGDALGTLASDIAAQLSVAGSGFTATSFQVSDLRLTVQIQRWLERNARSGVRYTEFLQSHFGVSPRDERMQRPEFLGGSKMPIIVSEVLQTSATGLTGGSTPQGGMAGHGLGVSSNGRLFSYFCEEFGLIMGILSVMPRSGYSQGVNRQWLRTTRYDFYSPEFAHLSEQPVWQGELFLDSVDADNQTVFGYQGIYDEMRYRMNEASGMFAKGQTLDYWHLMREFTAAPTLSQTFIQVNPAANGMKRVFADQTADHAFYLNVANIVKGIRPMPFEPFPGLVDHF